MERNPMRRAFGATLLSSIFALALAFSLVACGQAQNPAEDSQQPAQSEQPAVSPQVPAEEPAAPAEPAEEPAALAEPAGLEVTVRFDVTAANEYDSEKPATMEECTVTVNQGATVYDALVATGLALEGDPSYTTSIDGLAAGDCGEQSGWIFAVDGEMPIVGANECQLSGGETILWTYITSWDALS